MLPVRLGIVTAIAALCLWGLFSMLDSLQEPGLLRSDKAVVVKGCDPIESDEARRKCPALFCQKALLDTKLIPLQARFATTVERIEADALLIAGTASSNTSQIHFACRLSGTKVESAEVLDRAQWNQVIESR